MVSMQSISAFTAGGVAAAGSAACLYKAGETVTKAIKGDGSVSTFQNGLNKLLGPAGSETAQTARVALEAGTYTVAGLALANVSASLIDPDQSVVPHFGMFGVDRGSVDPSGLFTSEPEQNMFQSLAYGIGGAIESVANGVSYVSSATIGQIPVLGDWGGSAVNWVAGGVKSAGVWTVETMNNNPIKTIAGSTMLVAGKTAHKHRAAIAARLPGAPAGGFMATLRGRLPAWLGGV